MSKYVRKQIVVEAHQWFPPEVWPENCPCPDERPEFCNSIKLCEDKTALIYAVEANKAIVIEPGDYVVPEPDGAHFYPVKAEIFESNYSKLGEEPNTIYGAINFELNFDEKSYSIKFDQHPEKELAAMAIAREIMKVAKKHAIANIEHAKGKEKEMVKDRANLMTRAEYAAGMIVEAMIADRLLERQLKAESQNKEAESLNENIDNHANQEN